MISRDRTPLCGRSANSWILHDQSTCQSKWNCRTLYCSSETEGLHSCHRRYLSLRYIRVETSRSYVTNDQSSRRLHPDLWSSDRNWELFDRPGASVTLRCSIGCSDLLEENSNDCREILPAWKSVQPSVKTFELWPVSHSLTVHSSDIVNTVWRRSSCGQSVATQQLWTLLTQQLSIHCGETASVNTL
jgi:hypothetical protein